MNQQFFNVINELCASGHAIESVEVASNFLAAAATVLDGLGAKWSIVNKDNNLVDIIIEPSNSYDKTIFQVNVENRSIDKLN